ncbi:hypothetical protein OIU85_001080, partial [Salix viminalis]
LAKHDHENGSSAPITISLATPTMSIVATRSEMQSPSIDYPQPNTKESVGTLIYNWIVFGSLGLSPCVLSMPTFTYASIAVHSGVIDPTRE